MLSKLSTILTCYKPREIERLDQVGITRRGLHRGGRLREGQRGAEEQNNKSRVREKSHDILLFPLRNQGCEMAEPHDYASALWMGSVAAALHERTNGAARDSRTYMPQCPPVALARHSRRDCSQSPSVPRLPGEALRTGAEPYMAARLSTMPHSEYMGRQQQRYVNSHRISSRHCV
jgi:hypothetical protein